jgi:hypothetical protein
VKVATNPFLISIVAFGQFGFYYWRASVVATSTAPISNRVKVAAGISTDSLSPRDFRAILNMHEMTPELGGPKRKFRTLRAYYLAVENLGRFIPSVTGWAEAEMTMCSCYLAVLLDQHLDRNMAWAVRMCGL